MILKERQTMLDPYEVFDVVLVKGRIVIHVLRFDPNTHILDRKY